MGLRSRQTQLKVIPKSITMAPATVTSDQERQHALSAAQVPTSISGEAPRPSFVPPSPATMLAPMRSTESKTRLERGYLKKRSIDFIAYREGCPTDKRSKATSTVRDEYPFTEESSSSTASRDDCSSGDGGDQQQEETQHESSAQEDVHPLYVIQKTGTKSNHSQSTRVSKAYSFDEYWKIFDSVVEGCRCISIAGCSATGGVNTPVTSFGNSIDEADASSTITHRSLAGTPLGDSNNSCYYGHATPHDQSHTGVHRQNHPSPISSTTNVGSIVSSSFSRDTASPKVNATPSTSHHTSGQQQHMSPLHVLRDLERELSDDDDFRPAHRTSACFVLHEKDKVNDIFR